MTNRKQLFELFYTFAKIGLFTFGGGYAMIALIENNCVERKKWITHEDMMNITVIAESTPGPIAINCATFVGWQQAGILGAITATVGVILPSFLVIFAISVFLNHFIEVTVIANAFKGMKIAVGILILNAAFTMIKKMPAKIFPRIVMLCSFAVMLCINLFSWNFSSLSLMLTAAVVSLTLFLMRSILKQKKGGSK